MALTYFGVDKDCGFDEYGKQMSKRIKEQKRIVAGGLLAALALVLIVIGLRARIPVYNELDEQTAPVEISDRLMVRWTTQSGMTQRDDRTLWVEGSAIENIDTDPCPT